MMRKFSLLLALAGAALLLASFVPGPSAAGSDMKAAAVAQAPTPDPAAQGEALFRAKGCITCHRHEGVGVTDVGIGPDLTHYAGDPAFLRQWLANPAAVRPKTFMPNLELAPGEIEALIAFLGSQQDDGGAKGEAPARLAGLGELAAQARALARNKEVADPVLRQVITDLQATSFLFTDAAATVEVDVVVPEAGAAPARWDVTVLSLGKLVGHPGPELRLEALDVAPEQVAQAMQKEWPGCAVRSLNLVREDGALQWVGFCDTAAGTVSGTMANASGVFRPSLAPPARPPATATAAVVAANPASEAGAAPASCPVTTRPEQPFHPPLPYPPDAPYEGKFWYGTEALWTMLPEDGQWGQLAHGEKVWWWRVGFNGRDEPQPPLRLTARRLDGPAQTVTSGPPATNGYHEDFNWAMLSGLTVPAAGCWEVTGHYRGETLTFVVWVPQ